MSEKHKVFIESMVRLGKVSPAYVKPLKAITKCYIINEGIDIHDVGASACTTDDTAKDMQFIAVLESIADMGFRDLAKSVYDTYCITESTFGNGKTTLLESTFTDMEKKALW